MRHSCEAVANDYVKTAYLFFLAVFVLNAGLLLAHSGNAQQLSNYAMKQVVGEPGNGESRSQNYIFTHGTTWVGSAAAPPPPPPPCPPYCGGGSGGGSSFTGWIEEGPVGGVSPEVIIEVANEVPGAESVVTMSDEAPIAMARAIRRVWAPRQIIKVVDNNNMVREIGIVLIKRVIPWPLWLAFLLFIAGIISLYMARFAESQASAGEEGARGNLWLATGLIIAALAVGWATRVLYRIDPATFDIRTTASFQEISGADAGKAVRAIREVLPLGVHRIAVVTPEGTRKITITIVVKGALPI